MIVCSCNVLSDQDVRSAVAAERTHSTSRVYGFLGCSAQVFTPVEQRLARDAVRDRSLAVQEEAIAAWTFGIASRFSSELRARPIWDVPLLRSVA